MNDRVTISIDNGVADVRLNRPDKLNALDLAMFDGLVAGAERLAGEPGLRAVVLSGEGRAFCAGLDFASFMAMAAPADAPSAGVAGLGATDGRITHRAQQAAWGWHQLPVPVVAALHGAVLGGGLQIALAADVRIAHPAASLAVAEIRWGLVPDMTGTVTLSRLCGVDRAKELAMTGRSVDGTEAFGFGLVTRLADDPRTDALALAAEIAGRSPDAVRGVKRLLNRAAGLDADQVAAQFALERDEIGRVIGGPNQVEAVTAYFENRPPVFTDPQ
ncbi:MAG: crotonase/enoyl-CoA hydratase family protein [Acidimicrobiales bacterium]